MTYSQRIYGTSPRPAENRSDDRTDGKLIALYWRIFTNPASKRSLRYDKASKSAFAFAFADRFVENSRHRGALDQLQ
jgi:hypothetical protein